MPTYLMFTRDDVEKALECAGEMEAPDDDTARASARAQQVTAEHGGLVEMVLVPVDAAHWVVHAQVATSTGTPGAESGAT